MVRAINYLNGLKTIKNLKINYIPDKISVQFANAQALAGQLKLQQSRANIDEKMLTSHMTTDVE